jgi:hypothetical protein
VTPSLQVDNLTEIAGMVGTLAALFGTAGAAYRRGKAAETAAVEARKTTESEARKTRAQIEGVRKLSAPTGNGFAETTSCDLRTILETVREVHDDIRTLAESTDHRLGNLARSVTELNGAMMSHLQSPHPTERP